MRRTLAVGITIGMAAALTGHLARAQAPQAGFFITSAGPGKGADLGGLAGADAHCPPRFTALLGARRPHVLPRCRRGKSRRGLSALLPHVPVVRLQGFRTH